MAYIKKEPTQEFLKNNFNYISGELERINNSKPKKKYLKSRYRQTRIKDKRFLTHRLIWVFFNGSIENGLVVDHIDGNSKNNTIENLRAITFSQNFHNTKKARGCSCVEKRKKWRAYICINSKLRALGDFNTESEAHGAYLEAKKIHHPTAPINNEETK